ncbi:HSF-type DNA-binding-domain-containing protein [Coniella lustricola]|uniref:Transcription factor n=1 Tax=Coniella lustricola TaxID=2025994 RepID=A0A2T3ADG3_9PEZI|nr:HSF-type DNA-binding-domain-containing protein [Coniella lustricola]
MLEDPQYASIVRWGDTGDSFVVLENNQFTNDILPKHFKHSNFASFVRQLNKYDFHKVRQNEENGQSPYGPNAWEFKHPDFTIHNKRNLDNIRRKAPAPRKAQPAEDAFQASQQLALLTEQLNATQHQVQQLQEHVGQLTNSNKILVEELMTLQKNSKITNQVNSELLNHLNNLDERRRNSRHSAHSNHSGQNSSFHNGNLGVLPDGNDEPSVELRRARDLLNAIEPDAPADRAFQRLSVAYQANSPPDSAASSSIMYSQPNSAVLPANMLGGAFIEDPRHLVYPAGPNIGIDPFHPDHVNNLPFPMTQAPAEIPAQVPLPKKKEEESLWGARKPRIFLVEDDRTCSRIGSKFLSQIDCSVELAQNGEEAVNKINQEPDRFDVIFMDIIMPNMDGVSATVYIRTVAPNVPIIAMTSNIRAEEIAHYYQFGMNDTLAKPFTKEGMVKVVKKYCRHLLKNPNAADMEPNGGPMTGIGVSTPTYNAPPPVTGPGGLKFETTPINSPATSSSWHSPSQQLAQHTSPNMDGGYMAAGGAIGVSGPQMVMTPGGSFAPQMGTPSMPRMSGDMGNGEPPGKRQRIYTPAGGPAYRQ